MTRLDRRKFIQAALGAAACPMLLRCEFVNVRSDDAAVDVIDFDIAQEPFTGLQRVGGYACVQFGVVEVLILRRSEDSIVAYERMCPHLNLPLVACDGAGPTELKFSPDDQVIECTYHFSSFSAVDGSFISGEANKDLLRFAVEFDMSTGTGTVSPETA